MRMKVLGTGNSAENSSKLLLRYCRENLFICLFEPEVYSKLVQLAWILRDTTESRHKPDMNLKRSCKWHQWRGEAFLLIFLMMHSTWRNTRVFTWGKGTMSAVKMAWIFPGGCMDTLGSYLQTIMEISLSRSFSKCSRHWSDLKDLSISNSQFCFSFRTSLDQLSH